VLGVGAIGVGVALGCVWVNGVYSSSDRVRSLILFADSKCVYNITFFLLVLLFVL